MKRVLQVVAMAVTSLALGAGLLPAQSYRGDWGNGYPQRDRSYQQYREERRDDRGGYGYNNYRGYDDGYYRGDHRTGRSLAIVGGGAAAGAAIGGASKGGRGAAIGALIGGGAGLVIDQAVRHHHHDRY